MHHGNQTPGLCNPDRLRSPIAAEDSTHRRRFSFFSWFSIFDLYLGVKAVMNDGVGRRVGLQCCIISFAVYADSDELEVSSWSSKGA